MGNLAFFFVMCLLWTATPGPAVLYVSSQGVGGGLRAAVPGSVGILSADAFYFLLSVTGMGTVLLASYELFTVIRWIGAIYLVYLGLRLACARITADSAVKMPPRTPCGSRKSFAGGFLLHAANPKALLYFGSVLPQFVNPSRPLGWQLAALGCIHMATAGLVLLTYSVLSARFHRSTTGVRVRRVFNAAAGSCLVGAGVSLALTRQATR